MASGRARSAEYSRRVNQAMELLASGLPAANVAQLIAGQHGVSVRQGWRYVRDAAARSEPLQVAEPKIVFTVKVSQRLVQRIRALANARGQTLSGVVSEAMEDLLRRVSPGRRGRGESNH